MLQLTDISKAFVEQTVLEEINLQVTASSRIGLIGRNGCGKSTLLRVMMKELEPDSGTIYRAPGLSINCLTQEPRITPGNTLEQEVRSVFADLHKVVLEESALVAKLGTLTGDAQIKALNRLDTLHQEMERLDARSIDSRISRMVLGLGFSLEEFERPVEQFSGGWQMRINLAKVLLQGADILFLDEPTNHLDLEACEWLEGFLKGYPGGLIIVSHDRRFLDQITTEIAEIEFGRMTVYPGNYSSFLIQKEEAIALQHSAVSRQTKELAKQTAFVERFRASATKSTQAKSREKQLNKIERLEGPRVNNRRMSVSFPVPQASGKQVLSLRNLSKAYGDNKLFKDVNADLQRHQRVFLLGVNGCGKTTLLRLMMEIETPDTGEIRPGHNVNKGYFSQNQLDTLDLNSSMFDTLHNVRPDMTQTEIRGLLGQFLFTGDQVFKPVSVLSGGEKSKLALAKLMLSGPNLLFLDEPTNHMDIPAKEVLEGAFKSYSGTMLCISHDRYFIQELATEIWEIHEGCLLQYPGNYDYYLEKRDQMRATYAPGPAKIKKSDNASGGNNAEKTSSSGKSHTTPLREKREIEKKLKKMEKAIVTLETVLGELEADLHSPRLQQDYPALEALTQAIGKKQQELAQHNAEWEALAKTLAD